jgi:hypothetical protein
MSVLRLGLGSATSWAYLADSRDMFREKRTLAELITYGKEADKGSMNYRSPPRRQDIELIAYVQE